VKRGGRHPIKDPLLRALVESGSPTPIQRAARLIAVSRIGGGPRYEKSKALRALERKARGPT
jgi:hypothetical protein